MNYLAHAFLSFNNDQALLGNMISDFVKGRQQYLYPTDVQKGITLHRAIDEFTDMHPTTKQAKLVFKTPYRLYSGAFMDVVYDHFLALEIAKTTENNLFDFSQYVYSALAKQQDLFPPKFKNMFAYMRSDNWLYEYRTQEGIYKSFGGLVRRAAYLNDSDPAIHIFNQHYFYLQDCFRSFWAELKPFAQSKFLELNNT